MVQLLAHDAQAHWCPDNKLLYCANSFLREPRSVERLFEALFECWHLDQFTTSRWTTIGTSCRQLTLAIWLDAVLQVPIGHWSFVRL
eukprot:2863847-Amphidinium_carterae.1